MSLEKFKLPEHEYTWLSDLYDSCVQNFYHLPKDRVFYELREVMGTFHNSVLRYGGAEQDFLELVWSFIGYEDRFNYLAESNSEIRDDWNLLIGTFYEALARDRIAHEELEFLFSADFLMGRAKPIKTVPCHTVIRKAMVEYGNRIFFALDTYEKRFRYLVSNFYGGVSKTGYDLMSIIVPYASELERNIDRYLIENWETLLKDYIDLDFIEDAAKIGEYRMPEFVARARCQFDSNYLSINTCKAEMVKTAIEALDVTLLAKWLGAPDGWRASVSHILECRKYPAKYLLKMAEEFDPVFIRVFVKPQETVQKAQPGLSIDLT